MEILKWFIAILGTPFWFLAGIFKGWWMVLKSGYKAGRTGDYTELENLIREVKEES